MLLSVSLPCPGPTTTISFVRLLLSQIYTLVSPRTPNTAPHQPEAPKAHVLYQAGKPHKSGERTLSREVEALWRGSEVGGAKCEGQREGWKTRAVARMPNHEKIRPSTNEG